MTPTEALSAIYSMRESIANGWKPNQDQKLALALADMLDEVKVDSERYRFACNHSDFAICNWTEVRSYDGTMELGWSVITEKELDAARSNHEPL